MANNNLGNWVAAGVVDASRWTKGVNTMIADGERAQSAASASFTKLQNVTKTALGNVAASMQSGGIMNLSSFAGGLFGSVAGSALQAGASAFGQMTARAGEAAMGQRNLQRQFGLTATAAAGLREAALTVGIDDTALVRTLQDVGRDFGQLRQAINIGESAGQAGVALARLGLNARDFVNLPIDTALGQLGDRLNGVTVPSERMALAHSILGREWRELLPILDQGSAGLAAAASRATVLTDREIASIREMRVAVRDLNRQWDNAWTSMAVFATNRIKEITQMLKESAAGWEGMLFGTHNIDVTGLGATYQREADFVIANLRRIRREQELIANAMPTFQANLQAWAPPPAPPPLPPGIQPGQSALADFISGQPGQGSSPFGQAAQMWVAPENNAALLAANQNVQNVTASLQTGITTQQQYLAAGQAMTQNLLERAQAMTLTVEQTTALTSSFEGMREGMRSEIATFGMSADEATRYRLQLQGLSAARVNEIAQLQNVRAAQRQSATNDSDRANMLQAARSPLENLRNEARNINRLFAGEANAADRNRLLGRAFSSIAPHSEAPMMGGLSAGSSEVGAIMQQQASPQVERLTEITAILTSMRDGEAEQRRVMSELGSNFTQLLAAING